MVKIRIIVEISYDTEDHYNIVFWRPTLGNYNTCLGPIREVLWNVIFNPKNKQKSLNFFNNFCDLYQLTVITMCEH